MRRALAVLAVTLLGGGVVAWLLLARPAASNMVAPPPPSPPGAGSGEPATDEERAAPAAAADPAARNRWGPRAEPGSGAAPVVGAGASGDPSAPARSRIEIVDPPEDARELGDRAAHVAAEAYRNAVKALRLDPDQEERFKELLYDARQSYQAAMAIARQQLDDQHLEGQKRAAAEAEARRRAYDDQKVAADESIRDLLDERQQAGYRSLVGNPLFLANALQFRVAEPAAPR